MLRRALRTPHAQILREIVFQARGLETISDLLEYGCATLAQAASSSSASRASVSSPGSSALSPTADGFPIGGSPAISDLALMLCAACTRVIVVFVADPAVRVEIDEQALNMALLPVLFRSGAPLLAVWRLVVELAVFARIDDTLECVCRLCVCLPSYASFHLVTCSS